MKKQLAPSIAVILIGIIFIVAALFITPLSELSFSSDAAYPIFIGVLCLCFAVWVVIDERKKLKITAADTVEIKPSECTEDKKQQLAETGVFRKDVLIIIGMMVLYAITLYLIGYILATLLFTILSITFLGKRQFKTGLLVGFIATFMIVLVFKYVFNVILP